MLRARSTAPTWVVQSSDGPRGRRDARQALDFVAAHATTAALQARCVAALIGKTDVLWALLDALAAAYPDDRADTGLAPRARAVEAAP
jgi:pyrroloquinoline quinone (PQQ) biosynthesis protein C